MQLFYIAQKYCSQSVGVVLEELLKNDKDMLLRVYATLGHVLDLKGHPQPPSAKPLKNADRLCEMRTKYDNDNLLRIYYFVDKDNNRLVLLNYIIKPDGEKYPSHYEGPKGKKLKRDIEDSIQLAISLKSQYISNQNYYEPLPIE